MEKILNNRQSIRLKNFDYSSEWLYFITISAHNKLCLFWEILDWNFKIFDSWKMIKNEWLNLEQKYENIKLHNFVVMPNHFHWIIEIIGENDNCDKNEIFLTGTHKGHPYIIKKQNVGAIPCGCPENDLSKNKITIWDIIWRFKSITTNEYIKNVKNNNWIAFNKILWQRNYYEHIIRNEESYNKIVEYIENNPKKWDEDKFYYKEI